MICKVLLLLLLPGSLCMRQTHEVQTGGVQVTDNWVHPMDLTDFFVLHWKEIPVTMSKEFRIEGDLWSMKELLMSRSELEVSCQAANKGWPVYFVVTKPMPKAAEAFQRAFASGFANIAGFASLISFMGQAFHLFPSATKVASLVTALQLDKAIDSLLQSGSGSWGMTMKEWYLKLMRRKSIAYLTHNAKILDPRFAPPLVKFHCTEMEGPEPKARVTFDRNGTQEVLTSKMLALLVTALI
eukprot:s2894_g3.t1